MITLLSSISAAISTGAHLGDRVTVQIVEPLAHGPNKATHSLTKAAETLVTLGHQPLVLASVYPWKAFHGEPCATLLAEPFVFLISLPTDVERLKMQGQVIAELLSPTQEQIDKYKKICLSFWHQRMEGAVLHSLTSATLGIHTSSPESTLTQVEIQRIANAIFALKEFQTELGNKYAEIDTEMSVAVSHLENILNSPDDFAAAQDSMFRFGRSKNSIRRLVDDACGLDP